MLSQSIKHCAKHIPVPAGMTVNKDTNKKSKKKPEQISPGAGQPCHRAATARLGLSLYDGQENYQNISLLIIIYSPGLQTRAIDYFVYN